MSKAAVLFYTPTPAPYASKLLQFCALQGLKLRVLEGGDLDRTVSALAQGLRPSDPPPAGAPLPEPVMVFCSLTDRQLDRMLQSLRRLGVSCLKAVLTPSNAGWTLRALYDELTRERDQLGTAHAPSP